MSEQDDIAAAALEIVNEDLGIIPGQETEEPIETQDAVEDVVELDFTVDPAIPEDVQELLDQPEFDEEEEETPGFIENEEDDQFEYDEEKVQLKKALRKAQQEIEWNKKQRVTAQMAKWQDEASKFFPLADVTEITADSRRGFLKLAKQQHERNKKIVAPLLEKTAKEIEQLKAQAKKEAEEAWGNPTIPLSPTSGSSIDSKESEDEAFRRGGLAAMIRSTWKEEN